MKTVFVDTAYWVASVRPEDPWADSALRATDLLEDTQFVTTEEVLVEFLTGLSRGGARLRRAAAALVRELLRDPGVMVVPQSHASFLAGLDLYERRADKTYSLTDCISMVGMMNQSISDVLTTDRHFAQEGFNVLMTH